MTTSKPVAITPGCPAGIGPDILLQLAAQDQLEQVVIIADEAMLQARATQLGLEINWSKLVIESIPLDVPCIPGKPNSNNSHAIIRTLEVAVDGCLSGRFHAMVTGPVNKAQMNAGGIVFTGHTEWIAERCKTPHVVMLLATNGCKVALVTTHIPLREVANSITAPLLQKTIQLVHAQLQQRFRIASPRLTVTGLNPHAGEQGYLGREELDIIIPVLNELRQKTMLIQGPVAADTFFQPAHLAKTDCVIAMYHDQGLTPIKTLGFGHCVNVTLGLPIIRTSVDHGTAYDLVGSHKADPSSLLAAITLARDLSL